MSNTQYRDFLVLLGYSEDEARNMLVLITQFGRCTMKTYDELVTLLCLEFGYDGEYLRSKSYDELMILYNMEFVW